MKFSEIAHMYSGANIEVTTDHPNYPIATLKCADREGCHVTSKEEGWMYLKFSDNKITPRLKPVDEMTEDDLLVGIHMAYTGIFGSLPDIDENSIRQLEDGNGSGMVCKTTSMDEKLGITIEPGRGVEFSVNEQKMLIDQFAFTRLLLGLGYDVYKCED